MSKRLATSVFVGTVLVFAGVLASFLSYRAPKLQWTGVTPRETRVIAGLDPALIQKLKESSISPVLLYGEIALSGGVIKGDTVGRLNGVFDGFSDAQYIVWLAGAVPDAIASNGNSVMLFGCRYESAIWVGAFDLSTSDGKTIEFECTKLSMQEIPPRYDWSPFFLRLFNE